MRCRICGNDSGNRIYLAREMMFGFRDQFEYSACADCGCLQLINVPSDMSKYYPAGYYSFLTPEVFKKNDRDKSWVRFLRKERAAYMLGKRGFIGRLIAMVKPAQEELINYLDLLGKCNATFDSRILDVGCGKGKVIAELSWYGFKDLVGVDPYIEEDILTQKHVKIYKKDIYSLDGVFDVILLNHSFEHMPEPLRVLLHLKKLLDAGGGIIIRTPTVSSYAWEQYRENWVGIDAPRHLFLHSFKSMQILTSKTGLRIKEILFDSTEFQFWASLQYKQDIPLWDQRSFKINPEKSLFTHKDLEGFKQKAKELNEKRMGDQVCILLTKP